MDLCVGRVCTCPLQLLKADGAEEEDDVEQKEAESQPAVQPPAVQMDTQDLGEGGTGRESASFPVALPSI